MVRYVTGDLFDSKADIIAHGCNCKNGYGSGVAHTMSIKYPKAKRYFHKKYDEEGWNLGDVQFVKVLDRAYIANCATQDAFLPRGQCYADYTAILSCMNKLKEFAQAHNYTVAMPKIGAGLAGGDWTKIEAILNRVFHDYDVEVYVLEAK